MIKSNWSIAFFVLLSSLAGLFLGMLLSRFFIPKGVGLAGGAMVLGYGVLSFFVALVAGLIVQRYLNKQTLKRANLLLLLFNLLIFSWLAYSIYSKNKKQNSDLPPKATMEITKPATTPIPEKIPEIRNGQHISIGFAKPFVEADRTLYFYSKPQSGTPQDSIRFVNGPHGVDLQNTPSWLKPEVFKLDYELCYFQVKAGQNGFYQVILHRENQKSAWVEKQAVTFLDWPTFLLSMHSVEPKNRGEKVLHESPDNNSKLLEYQSSEYIFQPIRVQQDWIEVEVYNADYKKIGKGWIRWKKDFNLLVAYNLLS